MSPELGATSADLAWAPPPRGSWLRAVLAFPFALLAAFLIPAVMVIGFLIVPTRMRRSSAAWVRAWGRWIMVIYGVRLEVHGSEHRYAPGAAIILFNHVSLLDLMVLSTLWDEGGTVVYKQEFHRVPIIGSVMKHLRMIPIDRRDRERALASLRAAAAEVRERGVKVFMAPEGTRSRRGGLQEFKLGPFHLAMDTGAPVVPCVMRGIDHLNPVGSWLIRSGTVRVDFLPPVPTGDWSEDSVHEHAHAVRLIFLRYVPAAPAA